MTPPSNGVFLKWGSIAGGILTLIVAVGSGIRVYSQDQQAHRQYVNKTVSAEIDEHQDDDHRIVEELKVSLGNIQEEMKDVQINQAVQTDILRRAYPHIKPRAIPEGGIGD